MQGLKNSNNETWVDVQLVFSLLFAYQEKMKILFIILSTLQVNRFLHGIIYIESYLDIYST